MNGECDRKQTALFYMHVAKLRYFCCSKHFGQSPTAEPLSESPKLVKEESVTNTKTTSQYFLK